MTAVTDPIAAQLQLLVDTLTGVEVPASTDPAEVNTPGAWVALDRLEPLTLSGGFRVVCSVYLIAPDTNVMRATEQLAPMLRQLLTVITPDGAITTQGVVLPDSSTPLPAFRVPVNLKA